MRRVTKRMFQSTFPLKIDELEKYVESKIINPHDLSFTVYEQEKKRIAVFFIPYLVDQEKIDNHVLNPLLDMQRELCY